MRTGIACAARMAIETLDGPECCFVTDNGAETLKKCREVLPDVLILSGTLTGVDGRGVVEALRNMNLERMPAVVAVGWHAFECAAELERPDRAKLLEKLDEISDASGEILPLMRLRPRCADRISRGLDMLGVPARLKGRICLEKALEMILRDMELTAKLTRRLYPLVGNDMGIAPGGVERAIRTALENAWKRPQYEFFDSMVDPERGMPTVGTFLARAAEGIRMGQIG